MSSGERDSNSATADAIVDEVLPKPWFWCQQAIPKGVVICLNIGGTERLGALAVPPKGRARSKL